MFRCKNKQIPCGRFNGGRRDVSAILLKVFSLHLVDNRTQEDLQNLGQLKYFIAWQKFPLRLLPYSILHFLTIYKQTFFILILSQLLFIGIIYLSLSSLCLTLYVRVLQIII